MWLVVLRDSRIYLQQENEKLASKLAEIQCRDYRPQSVYRLSSAQQNHYRKNQLVRFMQENERMSVRLQSVLF